MSSHVRRAVAPAMIERYFDACCASETQSRKHRGNSNGRGGVSPSDIPGRKLQVTFVH